MLEKRRCSNLPYIIFGVLICVTGWQIIGISLPSNDTEYLDTIYTVYASNSSGYTYPTHILAQSDYTQLIDLNFSFNILNLVCNESTTLLLVLVHSAPRNYAKRRTIRETWGGPTVGDNIKILFMVGLANETNVQDRLDDENRQYSDIVQGNFLDTYRNITYKHVMVFKYVIYHCPHAKYILKTDDDVFVNMPTMRNFLTVDLSPYGARDVLFCSVNKNSKVLRTYRSKWRVSFSEYPQRNYPTYCPGWTLLYSPDVLFALYQEAQEADYFWIDDIHITGTIAEKLGIRQTNIAPFVISHKNLRYIVDRNYNVSKPFLYGTANLREDEIRALWKFVQTHNTPKSILKDF